MWNDRGGVNSVVWYSPAGRTARSYLGNGRPLACWCSAPPPPPQALTVRARVTSSPSLKSMLQYLTSSSLIPALYTPREGKNRKSFISQPAVTDVSLDILLAQPPFAGPDDRMSPVSNLQLGEDVGDMVAYGPRADKQTCGDLGVGVALGYEVEDLDLARGEFGESLLQRYRFWRGEKIHQAIRDLRSEVGFSSRHGAQHLKDPGMGSTL